MSGRKNFSSTSDRSVVYILTMMVQTGCHLTQVLNPQWIPQLRKERKTVCIRSASAPGREKKQDQKS